MPARDQIGLSVNGIQRTAAGLCARDSLAAFLRQSLGLTGTKIACNEGDCGSCTVLLGTPENGRFRYRAVNACITHLFQCDGAHVVTVEGVAGQIPNALASAHAVQCGFCTPGLVMALSAPEPDITGNLCRCTGYLSILEASQRADRPLFPELPAPPVESVLFPAVFIPTTLAEAATYLSLHPSATLIAGGTDLTPQRDNGERLLAYGPKTRSI